MQNTRTNRAIVFMAWGQKSVDAVIDTIKSSKLPNLPIFLIKDRDTTLPENSSEIVIGIEVDFKFPGLSRKTEIFEHLPVEYNSFLYLDSDTKVISDIEFGFEKAEIHGIALSPAPHYSLDHFFGFDKIMERENIVPRGQLQYNTGVIFFSMNEQVKKVFHLWKEIVENNFTEHNNDQPYFSLAMEKLNFNPYTLSMGYNYRGFGDGISGIVRIWHSHTQMPENINEFDKPWPPRRVINGLVVYPQSEVKPEPEQSAGRSGGIARFLPSRIKLPKIFGK